MKGRQPRGNASRKRIVRALRARPGLSLRRLGQEVGLSQTTTWQYVQELKAEGIIAPRTCPTCKEPSWAVNDDMP